MALVYLPTEKLLDEDKCRAKLYVKEKEILLKFFSEYLEFCDNDEDEMVLVG